MIRTFDILFSLFGLIILSPLIILVLLIGFIETKSPIFCQERIGKNQKKFTLFKFRSMYLDTKSISTHLVDHKSVTKFGEIIRKSKIDEIPQLINVLKGDMSIVGPRPNLLNQEEVIFEREKLGVYSCPPGITGLSQINKIDMSIPKKLAESDAKMIKNLTLISYFKIIIKTFIGKGFGDRIKRD